SGTGIVLSATPPADQIRNAKRTFSRTLQPQGPNTRLVASWPTSTGALCEDESCLCDCCDSPVYRVCGRERTVARAGSPGVVDRDKDSTDWHRQVRPADRIGAWPASTIVDLRKRSAAAPRIRPPDLRAWSKRTGRSDAHSLSQQSHRQLSSS